MNALAVTIPHSNPAAASPDAVEIWNRVVAPKYARHEQVLVQAADEHSRRIWEQLPAHPGQRIVDLGCGFGDSSRQLAERETSAEVIGIDCAEPLLQLARQRHGTLPNLQFVLRDAGLYRPPHAVDLCFSRFGLMFFERPVSTLRHIRSWMRPGASLHALVWRARDLNPWLSLAREVVLEHLPPVDDGAPSCGPGPFSMADESTTTAILEAAGFSEIQFRSVRAPVWLGNTAAEAAAFQLAIGPAGEIYRHALEAKHSGLDAARRALEVALAEHESEQGVVLNSASWWVEASNDAAG